MIEQGDVDKINGLTDQILPIRRSFDEAIEGTKGEFTSLGLIIINIEAWADRIVSISQRVRHDPIQEEVAQACKNEVTNFLNAYSEEQQELAKVNFTDRGKITRFVKESLDEFDRISVELGQLTEYYFTLLKPN